MPDQSALDSKYFIDEHVYNCPFCNRRHVAYVVTGRISFDWTAEKKCWVYFVKCLSCESKSMHLSYTDLSPYQVTGSSYFRFAFKGDLDSEIFYSVPTSFFVMDKRIPRILRELITEAEGSLKMNFLTGASSCTRKAIYELLVIEEAVGGEYDARIKSLKAKYPNVDPTLVDVLGHIQDMTSDKVHEQSWDKWDSPQLRLILETLKAVLHEIYVVPKEKEERVKMITQMRERMMKDKKPAAPVAQTATTPRPDGQGGNSAPSAT